MIFTIEKFLEKGFNTDLTLNDFGIVLSQKYQLGFSKIPQGINCTIQNPNKTYFLTLWFTKARAKEYFGQDLSNVVFKTGRISEAESKK